VGFGAVIVLTVPHAKQRQALAYDLRERSMKLLMPPMLTAPALVQGGMAMPAMRADVDVRTRKLKRDSSSTFAAWSRSASRRWCCARLIQRIVDCGDNSNRRIHAAVRFPNRHKSDK
jgi:hypothetical protein